MNEVLQWAAIAALAIPIAGLYWHHARATADSVGDMALRSGPPLNRRLPKEAFHAVREAMGGPLGQETVIAFVSESCPACAKLLSTLENPPRSLPQHVIVSANSSPDFAAALAELPSPTIHDDGTLFRVCNIQVTPFLVNIDTDGYVRGKSVEHELSSFQKSTHEPIL